MDAEHRQSNVRAMKKHHGRRAQSSSQQLLSAAEYGTMSRRACALLHLCARVAFVYVRGRARWHACAGISVCKCQASELMCPRVRVRAHARIRACRHVNSFTCADACLYLLLSVAASMAPPPLNMSVRPTGAQRASFPFTSAIHTNQLLKITRPGARAPTWQGINDERLPQTLQNGGCNERVPLFASARDESQPH